MADKINIASLDKFDESDFVMPITLGIADFRDLSSRKGSASKTITLPATKKNNSIFSYYNDPNTIGLFDVNKRQEGFIDTGAGRIIEGGLHLVKARNVDGIFNRYEVVIFGNNAEWFSRIKDKSIKDIPLSSFVFTKELIEASWELNGNTGEAVYPLIDYGAFEDADSNNVVAEDFRPAVFIKPMLISMFKELGYTIESKFLEKQQYRDLIMPFTEDKIVVSQDFTEDQAIDVEAISGQLDIPKQSVVVNYDVGVDQGDNFNFSDNSYTTKLAGTYEINASLIMGVDGFAVFKREVSLEVWAVTPGVIQPQIIFGTVITIPALFDPNGIPNNMFVSGVLTLPDETNITVRVRSTILSPDYNIDLIEAKLTVTPKQLDFSEDFPFNLASTLPDIKQEDWLKDLIARFGLYLDTDNRRKVITIETWNDFFLDINEAEDWTEKLDTSRSVEQEPITEGISKRLNYTWLDDSDGDTFIKDYKEGIGVNLGDGFVELDNERLQGVQEIVPSVFSATIMGNQMGGSKNMPVMVQERDGNATYQFLPRLLIYDGLRGGTIVFEGVSRTTYPFAYFQKPTSIPTDVNLNFRNLNDIFELTNDQYVGLIERIYGRQINQINKGRVVKAFMRLTDADIASISFRTPKLINNTYYYLNKIEDYQAGGRVPVKVELLQKIN